MSPSDCAALLAAARAAAPRFIAQDVARTLWALARLVGSSTSNSNLSNSSSAPLVLDELPHLIDALQRRAAHIVPSFNAQDVSNSLWALARLSSWRPAPPLPPALLDALQHRFAAVCNGCGVGGTGAGRQQVNGQNLSNALWALVRLCSGGGGGGKPALSAEALEAAARRTKAVAPFMEPCSSRTRSPPSAATASTSVAAVLLLLLLLVALLLLLLLLLLLRSRSRSQSRRWGVLVAPLLVSA